jgi:hypothetical protein
VEANFAGGDITSDGGVLLLRQVDRVLDLSEAVAQALGDGRRQASCWHDAVSMLRQRVYGLALGYEDLNDHDTLRKDLAMQTGVDRDEELGSGRGISECVDAVPVGEPGGSGGGVADARGAGGAVYCFVQAPAEAFGAGL